jgi:hypothetical protein
VRVVSPPVTAVPPMQRVPSGDYFTHRRRSSRVGPLSPGWPRTASSPTTNVSTSLGSASSRGSWSSLFNTSSMRQLVGVAPEPQSAPSTRAGITDSIPVPGGGRRKAPLPDSPRGKDDPSPPQKSWDLQASNSTGSRLSVTFIANHSATKAPTFSQVVSSKANNSSEVVVIDLRDKLRSERCLYIYLCVAGKSDGSHRVFVGRQHWTSSSKISYNSS